MRLATRFKEFTDEELLQLGNWIKMPSLSKEIETEFQHRRDGFAAARDCESYYFGCYGTQAGHFFRAPNGRAIHTFVVDKLPEVWRTNYDGGLPPSGSQIEGLAKIHYADCWTALSFWDRSVDHRGNSNSNFFFKYPYLQFSVVLALAKATYPEIFKRFEFEIKEYI